MDPFLDLIRLLRPTATLWGGLEGAGRWGLSFHQRDDLLFCWVERGQCQLIRPGSAPLQLAVDDFVLIRTATPFTLTSDASVAPVDSEALVAATQDTRFKLGDGADQPVTLRAGRFVFDSVNANLLTELLPQITHIAAGDTRSIRVRQLLSMNEMEFRHPGPGSDFVVARLMELVLVEILRARTLRLDGDQIGLIAGLADPIIARALTAIHGNVAHSWTVAALARHCGVSRSGFATRFRRVVGKGPIDYLLRWRMALAREELRHGKLSIGEIARAVGFQSASAFNTAFSRSEGLPPRRFAVLSR